MKKTSLILFLFLSAIVPNHSFAQVNSAQENAQNVYYGNNFNSAQNYGQETYFGASKDTQQIYAQNTTNTNTNSNSSKGDKVRDLGSLIDFLMKYLNTFMYLVISFGVVMFVYNVIMYYVVKAEEDRAKAKEYVIYSVMGLFLIVSFWGIVNFVTNTLGLDNNKPNIQNIYFK